MFLLKPSLIPDAGIGVFTSQPLKKNDFADIFDPLDGKFVEKPQPEQEVEMLNHFGIETETGWHIPLDYRRISVGWYLNHSDTPNLIANDDHTAYYANREILANEELTIDYSTLDEGVDNSL